MSASPGRDIPAAAATVVKQAAPAGEPGAPVRTILQRSRSDESQTLSKLTTSGELLMPCFMGNLLLELRASIADSVAEQKRKKLFVPSW